MPDPDHARGTRRAVLTTGGAGLALAACSAESGGATSSSSSAAAGSSSPVGDGGTSLGAADVPVGGGTILQDAKIVVTQPAAGEFKAFSAVCTHQGCVVSGVTETIDCACHQSHFSLSDGSVVAGPAPSPLPAKTVTVAGDQLTIS